MRRQERDFWWRLMKTALLTLIILGPGLAARAATTTATSQAVIVRPLSIVKTADLRFGSIIPGAAAGTVNINPGSGLRTSSGPLTLVGTDYGSAHFVGYADRFRIVLVTRGPLPVLTRTGGGPTMTMNVTGLSSTGTLFFVPAASFIDIDVGGTLAVGANQAPGFYTGTFNITMTYF